MDDPRRSLSDSHVSPRLFRAGLALGLVLLGREALARRGEVDLHGRVALITGASRGLGFLLTTALAREGCRVAICARDGDELERARRAYCDTVTPFDYLSYANWRSGRPERSKIKALLRDWFENGRPLVIELQSAGG